MRGQLSLETLLVAAALLAFLAFLLPSVSRVFDALQQRSVDSGEQKVFDELVFKAREASTLGPGTRFYFESSLPADNTSFSFLAQSGSLQMGYWHAGKARSFNSSPFFTPFSVPSGNFSPAKYVFVVENKGGQMVFTIEKTG